MIARLLRALKRRLLESEIRDMEADLTSIAASRKNDDAAEACIRRELMFARRQAYALAQEDLRARAN